MLRIQHNQKYTINYIVNFITLRFSFNLIDFYIAMHARQVRTAAN